MTLPEAGWLTDPDDPERVRWWNGSSWTDQRKDPDQTLPAPLTRWDKARQVRTVNRMAFRGLILSLVAFLINPLAILSVLGIVISSIGLARSRRLAGSGHAVSGRGTALVGIAVGVIGTVIFAYLAFQNLSR